MKRWRCMPRIWRRRGEPGVRSGAAGPCLPGLRFGRQGRLPLLGNPLPLRRVVLAQADILSQDAFLLRAEVFDQVA